MSLRIEFNKTIRDKIAKEGNYKNIMEIPRIIKVVINVGAGEAASNKNAIGHILDDLTIITGQKPVITKARKSVSAFKIRKGMPIGVKVTLRNALMYDFIEKLFKIVLPRIRDFRGIPKNIFDGRGNLNIGINDQTLFPEIDYDKIDKIRGMEITIVTTANDNKAGELLFKNLGFPFTEEEKK